MMENSQRNTELRRKVQNVGRPEDNVKDAATSKLAKQGEIKTKIIDEATKKKMKEDDQSDDPIARINAVTSNIKQMTNEPKPAPSLPNVNDIPSSNPASKMFKIKEAKEAKDDDGKKSDMDDKDAKEIKGGKTEVIMNPKTDERPEESSEEDKKSKKATKDENKKIGTKSGVKEETMSNKNFGLPQSLIDVVSEALKGGQKNLDKNHNGKIDGEDFKILRGKKMKEESEKIDEVSKKTLSNYIRKASSDAANHAYTAGMGDKGEMRINRDEYHMKASSRLQGVSKAAQKLAKEEVEFSAEEIARIEEIAKGLK